MSRGCTVPAMSHCPVDRRVFSGETHFGTAAAEKDTAPLCTAGAAAPPRFGPVGNEDKQPELRKFLPL